MINATKEKLGSFFQGTIQYEVPFFQRAYVWDEDNWNTLWEHVITVLDEYERGTRREHFIGTIITKQRPPEHLGQQIYDLIDGQQRLTTIALLFQAIADTATGAVPRLKEVVSDYVRFRDTHDLVHQRIIPSSYDRPPYEVVMSGRGENPSEQEHRIVRAYAFFRERLVDVSDEWRDRLRLVLQERVSVISMMLSTEDDEQEIFDTINALGVRLTTAELLKNFIFKDRSIQPDYDEVWRAVFEDSEEEVEFWSDERTAGRIIRTNIEVLLYCYLVIRTGRDVRLESLFAEYKQWLHGQSGAQRLAFLRELKGYAEIYSAFPSGAELNEIGFNEREKRFFHIIERLTITTVLPLVLYIYQRVEPQEQRAAMLLLLESYLVRRNVCRLTTKRYNLLFVQIVNRLQESSGSPLSVDALLQVIRGFDDETNRMPSDQEFRDAFGSQYLSNQNAREILFLLGLKQVSDGLADQPKLSVGNYTVEHMMPSKWKENWMVQGMTLEEMTSRDRAIRTLGNLTLVTGRLNSKMQNASWSDKRRHLREHSSLPMTVRYLESDQWDETSILRRAQDLATVALTVWPSSASPQHP